MHKSHRVWHIHRTYIQWMEFLGFDTVLGMMASLSCLIMGLGLLRHPADHRPLSYTLFAISLVTFLLALFQVHLQIQQSFLVRACAGSLLVICWALDQTLQHQRSRNQVLTQLFTLTIFAIVTSRLLVQSGLVLGTNFELTSIVLTASLTFSVVRKNVMISIYQLQKQLNPYLQVYRLQSPAQVLHRIKQQVMGH